MLIVDDQLPFRAVARTVIGLTGGFAVAGEAETGEDAVTRSKPKPPDLVLMDINLPGHQRHRGDPPDPCRAPADGGDPAVDVLRGRPPADARDCGAIAYVHKEDFGPALVRELWDGRPTPG